MKVVKKLSCHAVRFDDTLLHAEIEAQQEVDICLKHRGVWNDPNFKGVSLLSGSKHPNIAFPRTTESRGDVIVDRHALTKDEKGGEGAKTRPAWGPHVRRHKRRPGLPPLVPALWPLHGLGHRCTRGLPGEPPSRVPRGWRATQSHSANASGEPHVTARIHAESAGLPGATPVSRDPHGPCAPRGMTRPSAQMLLPRGHPDAESEAFSRGPVHGMLQQSRELVLMAADAPRRPGGRTAELSGAAGSTGPRDAAAGAGLCQARVRAGGGSERGTP